VRPRGQCAHRTQQHQNQDHDQNSTEHFSSPSQQ
jgi:hypothetical protein